MKSTLSRASIVAVAAPLATAHYTFDKLVVNGSVTEESEYRMMSNKRVALQLPRRIGMTTEGINLRLSKLQVMRSRKI